MSVQKTPTDPLSERWIVSRELYVKAVLHAAAHLHDTVIGLVLGRQAEGDREKTRVIQCQEALPLFHHWTDCGMPWKAAYGMSKIYAQKRGLEIIGCYTCYANPRQPLEITGQVLRICNTIRDDGRPSALAIVIDSLALDLDEPRNAFQVSTWRQDKWEVIQTSAHAVHGFGKLGDESISSRPIAFESQDLPEEAAKAIMGGAQDNVVDFDDFLDGKGRRWLT